MYNNNRNTDRQTGLCRRTLAPSIQLRYSLQPPSYTRVSAHCLRTQCHRSVTGLYTICSSSRTKWPVHKPDHCTVSSAELNTWRCISILTYTLHGILLNLWNIVVLFHSFSMCVVQQYKLRTLHSVSDKWLNECGEGGMMTVEMELLGERNLSQCHVPVPCTNKFWWWIYGSILHKLHTACYCYWGTLIWM